jgi:hypothetical protein
MTESKAAGLYFCRMAPSTPVPLDSLIRSLRTVWGTGRFHDSSSCTDRASCSRRGCPADSVTKTSAESAMFMPGS